MTIRRTRIIREGDAKRDAARAAQISAALTDERARHRIAIQAIAARRSQVMLKPDAATRAAALAVVAAATAKEDQRHRTKIKSLQSKLNLR